MRFLYPFGLLGLIGIPLLILIYIIKNRYTEQTIASTYLWTLSEKFLKRRNPLAKITGIISLILQILLVLTLSLIVAHPIIILPEQAKEYCFILDGSGSMNMETDGETRFDRARGEILDVIDSARDGSVFSLVLVTDVTEVIFELNDNRELIKDRIMALECSPGYIDYTDSIGVAQGYFNENPSALTYLVTDMDCEDHKNVNVINVAATENNISVDSFDYSVEADGKIAVMGELITYGSARQIDIELYADDGLEPIGTFTTYGQANTPVDFAIKTELTDFYSLTVKIMSDDSMAIDNEATLYNIKSVNAYKTLLVSDTEFFMKSVIESLGNADLTVMKPDEYYDAVQNSTDSVRGYGLYIFDAYTPEELPRDGSVWLIDPSASIDGSGFSVQGEFSIDGGAELTVNNSSASLVKKLTDGMINDSIYISKYVKCGVYGDFTSIYTYMGSPMIFTGINDFGNREVVFAFNFHDSDYTLTSDYVVLVRNLLDYSFPAVVEKTEYFCGDVAAVNVVTGCESIRVEPPRGEAFYLNTNTAVGEFILTEAGEYKIIANISGSERVFYIYSSVPKEERNVVSTLDSIAIVGEPANGGRDGKIDNLTLLYVAVALLFSAEWVVYCYDKYQLR